MTPVASTNTDPAASPEPLHNGIGLNDVFIQAGAFIRQNTINTSLAFSDNAHPSFEGMGLHKLVKKGEK